VLYFAASKELRTTGHYRATERSPAAGALYDHCDHENDCRSVHQHGDGRADRYPVDFTIILLAIEHAGGEGHGVSKMLDMAAHARLIEHAVNEE
jgi:hypothetical protein